MADPAISAGLIVIGALLILAILARVFRGVSLSASV